MKRHLLLISNLIIIFFIVAGFTAVMYKDTRTYQDLAEKHLENIVSLADTNIFNYIENTMDKPVMVAKTMANDEFLKAWLLREPQSTKDPAYLEQLYGYLKAYQDKYDYTTVFCVSGQTGNYYYQDGLNKTVSRDDSHDIWYYNFMDSGKEYDLEVDTNEENNNTITIFVNFRVDGDDGSTLGVIGVGLKVSSVEKMIRVCEDDYGLSVYLINVGGAQNSFTGDTDIFVDRKNLAARTGISEEIMLNKSGSSDLQWFTSGGERKCLITKYDEILSWYLVLEKDTDSISSSFQQSIKNNVVFMLISLLACVLVTTAVFIIYNRRIIVIENIDELTGLPNRKLFLRQYLTLFRRHRDREKTMFMLDIDHFKEINDANGHMVGNAVLSLVGSALKSAVGRCGVAARWGGDEFLGVLTVSPEEAEKLLRRFMDSLRKEEIVGRCRLTVSVGLAEVNGKLSADQMIKKVDQALYRSKEAGRDRITLY